MLKYIAVILFAVSIQAHAAVATSTPKAPSNLKATVIASSTSVIVLSWSDNSNNEDLFMVDMAYVSSNTQTLAFKFIGASRANTPFYIFASTTPGVSYKFRVSAYNNVGQSEYSNVATATAPVIQTAPKAPSNLVLSVVASSSKNLIYMKWNDNSDNETGFYVEEVKNTFYTTPNGTSTRQTTSIIATIRANVNSYLFSSTTPGAYYYFQVRALNQYGTSTASNMAFIRP